MVRLIFLFIIIASSIKAQSNRFYYEFQFKNDTISSEYKKEYFVLDVNPKSVKFFSLIDYKNDSIMKLNKQDSDYQRTAFHNYISRKRNSFNNTKYFFAGETYVKMESRDEMKWKILSEVKTIGTYKVQAATTEFGGRKWVAWFTNSIPINEGPYKFCGLPGMILEIYDNDKYFHFVFVKNEKLKTEYNTSDIMEKRWGETPLLINKKQYLSLKQKEYDNPFEQMIAYGTTTYEDESGKEVPYDFKQMTLEKQKELRAKNNFIEKEFIVKYK